MSRAKSRQNNDVCADCGAPDPSWASINKGIYLCVECCSIHRSLGRHISQVKSLHKSTWSPSQLAMVQALSNTCVNNIWEHALLEGNSKSKKKSGPKDSLAVKTEFIKNKHQQCAFMFRPNNEDGLLCVENELGKQLHASVRSSNLETSMRFLIQGADPNYFHDEKGSTPLHVAVKSNQILQIELLVTYGADPTYPDAQGKTPIDYARQNINKEIANRLIECQYEVTDKFSNYLCHRKPDHLSGLHFLIPQSAPKSVPNGTAKLRKLPNHLFEELVMDVYDEVDRREIEAIWLSSVDTLELNANTVPFLPVDSSLSRTRNQGRQKLGRFTTPELKSLVYDILIDTQRRQISAEKASAQQLRQFSQISDDEPLYDSVASDEDYALLAQDLHVEEQKPEVVAPDKSATLQLLTKTISGLKTEVTNLKAVVEKLNSENTELRTRLSQAEATKANDSHSLDGFLLMQSEVKHHVINGQSPEIDLRHKKGQRPSSMYETREGLRTPNWQSLKNQIKQDNLRGVTQSLYSSSRGQTIMQCTEQVTKGIQQLWSCIQGANREECSLCADKIQIAVANLTGTIPSESNSEAVRHLLGCVSKLQKDCSELLSVGKDGESPKVDYCLQQIRLSAYEVAKGTKQLVTKYTAN